MSTSTQTLSSTKLSWSWLVIKQQGEIRIIFDNVHSWISYNTSLFSQRSLIKSIQVFGKEVSLLMSEVFLLLFLALSFIWSRLQPEKRKLNLSRYLKSRGLCKNLVSYVNSVIPSLSFLLIFPLIMPGLLCVSARVGLWEGSWRRYGQTN